MQVYDGVCADTLLATTTGNVGDCEIACLNNLQCKSAFHAGTACSLFSGTCQTVTAGPPGSTVLKLRGTLL